MGYPTPEREVEIILGAWFAWDEQGKGKQANIQTKQVDKKGKQARKELKTKRLESKKTKAQLY